MASNTEYMENNIRILALIAAGILLNIGLFFILSILAPIIAGLACAFFFNRYRIGLLVGLLSAFISYSIIFATTSSASTDFFSLLSAVLIMTILGVIGGVLGVLLHNRTSRT